MAETGTVTSPTTLPTPMTMPQSHFSRFHAIVHARPSPLSNLHVNVNVNGNGVPVIPNTTQADVHEMQLPVYERVHESWNVRWADDPERERDKEGGEKGDRAKRGRESSISEAGPSKVKKSTRKSSAPAPLAMDEDDDGEGDEDGDIKKRKPTVRYPDRGSLLAALKDEFRKDPDVDFAGAFDMVDNESTHKQRVQSFANEIWKTVGYRFTVKDHPQFTNGHKTRFWCSQDEAHRSKSSKAARKAQGNCYKPRVTNTGEAMAKARFSCRSRLLISSRDSKNRMPGMRSITVRMHHHLNHEPYVDASMPPEMIQSVWEAFGWTPQMQAQQQQQLQQAQEPQASSQQVEVVRTTPRPYPKDIRFVSTLTPEGNIIASRFKPDEDVTMTDRTSENRNLQPMEEDDEDERDHEPEQIVDSSDPEHDGYASMDDTGYEDHVHRLPHHNNAEPSFSQPQITSQSHFSSQTQPLQQAEPSPSLEPLQAQQQPQQPTLPPFSYVQSQFLAQHPLSPQTTSLSQHQPLPPLTEKYHARMKAHIKNLRDFCDGLEYQLQCNDYSMLNVLEQESGNFLKLVEDSLHKEKRKANMIDNDRAVMEPSQQRQQQQHQRQQAVAAPQSTSAISISTLADGLGRHLPSISSQPSSQTRTPSQGQHSPQTRISSSSVQYTHTGQEVQNNAVQPQTQAQVPSSSPSSSSTQQTNNYYSNHYPRTHHNGTQNTQHNPHSLQNIIHGVQFRRENGNSNTIHQSAALDGNTDASVSTSTPRTLNYETDVNMGINPRALGY